MADHFGAPWPALGYTVLVTAATYVTTLVAVRAVSRDPSYLGGVAALVTLLWLRVGVAPARRRWDTVARALDFRPLVVLEPTGGLSVRHAGNRADVAGSVP